MSEEEEDWISALPDAILHQILSLLPTKQSIRTSILSKRWINLWKFTPVIDIPITGLQNITQSDCTFIHNALTQHQALKLHKFRLDFSTEFYTDDDDFENPIPDVQHCIEFALSRQVQILSVSAHLFSYASPEEHYVLPDMFYSHDNITSLEQVLLKGILFDPNLPCVPHFASLKTLCFIDCVIDDETLKGLISNCPLLESLTIDSCHRLNNFKASWCQSMRLKHLVLRWMDELWISKNALNLEIDVSSLTTFKFSGELSRITFGSLPSMIEVTVLHGPYGRYGEQLEHIKAWSTNLAHVKKLGVNSWFTEFLAIEHKMKNSSRLKIFENLEVFSWFGSLAKESDIIAVITFLSHCPTLEKIEIDFRSYYWKEVDERNRAFARDRRFIELNNGDGQPTVGFLHNLKIVMVHHFFGYKSEIEFIKHLLQKAVVLETLSLTYHRLLSEYSDGYLNRTKESVEEEILSLPRASSHVDILFH